MGLPRFKTLRGLSRYAIWDDGCIQRHDGLVMKTRLNDESYVKVKLTRDDGSRRDYFVHWLVATAFVRKRDPGQYLVRHKDGCRTNCRADNLRWGTHAQNHQDKIRHGTFRHVPPKLSLETVREIRASKLSAPKLAKDHGISISHAREVKNGRKHRRVPNER
jgi:hypothetical protein